MKIAFLAPYPIKKAPSQRFRFEQQLEFFESKGMTYDFYSFLSDEGFDVLYKPNKFWLKTRFILAGFLKRMVLMFSLKPYQFVFLHREASPIGPPIFEFIITKILKKKLIYDFDDAIWLSNTSSANKIVAGIKWHDKVSSICSWAYKISCGNSFLANYARTFNHQVYIIPTTVDTEKVHNKTKNQEVNLTITIGWTGTHSTIQYLYEIEDLLVKLQQDNFFNFLVISNKDPNFKTLKYEYIAWKKQSEIQDLLKMNIGIMPLKNDKWSKGKCGFKAIQYMSLGIPAVVSKVGVNEQIVDHQKNGFVFTKYQDWENALKEIMNNENLRKTMGHLAQEKIRKSYSAKSQRENYLALFNFSS